MDQGDHGLTKDMSVRGMINVTADSKVLDFLRLLEEYRRKCEEQCNYAEARKSRSKFEELLKKEIQRQRNNIRAAHEQELQNIEAAQKAQFLEFSQAWDNYMSDYEATAYLSLEKLKVSLSNGYQQLLTPMFVVETHARVSAIPGQDQEGVESKNEVLKRPP